MRLSTELHLIQTELPSPVRLALISDTHIFPDGRRVIPKQLLDLFERSGIDRIIHGGDVVGQPVLDELGRIAPVLAVRGNNDNGAFGESLPLQIELKIGKRRIRVMHGHGYPNRTARAAARENALGVDMVIYGHSHIPRIEKAGAAVLLNPGSATDRRWHEHFGVGFLEVSDQILRPELVLFTNPAALDNVTIKWSLDRN